jgi:Lipocalin-like domain
MRTDRPKYKSGTRMRGSIIENQATSRGVLSYFGTFSIDEKDHTLTYHVENSSFPNMIDTSEKRVFTLADDDLKYQNPTPRRGGPPTVLEWKRIK